jgi:hypothetical protein
MHLIIAHASALPGLHADALEVPALREILQRWSMIATMDATDDDAPLACHEQVWGRALGGTDARPMSMDHPLSFAPLHAAADGLTLDANVAWAVVSPVHARVSIDSVSLVDPMALDIDEASSRAFFDTLAPWFESAGHSLVWGTAWRWYASHPGFATLSTASMDRVAGDAIDGWKARGEHAMAWHRLQNECQMLLHTHPANEAREARGLAPINSIWLGSTGPAAPLRTDVQMNEDLRSATILGDAKAAQQAWQRLDRQHIAALLEQPSANQRLSLCSRSRCIHFEPKASWWSRLKPRKTVILGSVLERLSS